ncbi:MAG: glycosyltransferase family 4 protein [Nitrospirae bacterium]|nr:glycosyltransferase family 4 protein [Nitrospirota bacterium]
MVIWLVHIGELLPVDGPSRLFRYGILAEMLADRGHSVVRWAPTFVHAHKRQRVRQDSTIRINDRYRIELLYARGYNRNIGFGRLWFNHQMTRAFRRRIRDESPPDIILSGLPTPGMCKVAIEYAGCHNIPVVIDVRDLWPDIFLTVLPKGLQRLGRLALQPAFNVNRLIFREADAVTAVSRSYLDWGLKYAGRERRETDAVFPLAFLEESYGEEEMGRQRRFLLDRGVVPERFICCFWGQFEASYDIETLIDAAVFLERTHGDKIQFVLCGDGGKMSSLRRRTGRLKNVVLPGWVSPATIRALMEISDVGLAAYVENAPQSLPNKVFEYFSGGLPVLSSLRGELDRIISENRCGLLYGAGDAKSLVSVILKLYDDPRLRRRMGGNARRLFEERFSAARVYTSMIDHLERMAGRGTARVTGI